MTKQGFVSILRTRTRDEQYSRKWTSLARTSQSAGQLNCCLFVFIDYLFFFIRVGFFWLLGSADLGRFVNALEYERKRLPTLSQLSLDAQVIILELSFKNNHSRLNFETQVAIFKNNFIYRYVLCSLVRAIHASGQHAVRLFGNLEHDPELYSGDLQGSLPGTFYDFIVGR